MPKRVTVLVVLMMLVVGAGLLAAFIGKVRETARGMHCANNLKQLGLALQYYHDAHVSFPPGTLPNSKLPPEKRFSWLLIVLPYMESRAGLVLDTSKAWDADENRELWEHQTTPKFPEDKFVLVGRMRFLLCPSNSYQLRAGFPSLAHYVGVAGLGSNAAQLPRDDSFAGVFGYDRCTTLKDLKQGAANTLFLAETAWENGPWTAGGPPTVRGLDPSRPYLGGNAQFGTHPGGGNSVFADGSVRFLDESMEPRLFEAMATIAGGEDTGAVGN